MRPRRIEALQSILQAFPEDPLVLTCGATSREAASLGRRDNCLYVVDSMGLVGPIALGLALGLQGAPFRKVVAVEGDGGLLMDLNCLATAGYLKPDKFLMVVLDNESYASTGGQPTYTTNLDLTAIATACGLRTWACQELEPFAQALQEAREAPGPGLVRLKLAPGNERVPYLTEDPAVLRHTFETFLRSAVAGRG
ncbi:MAG: phosphonopyruvate decarboxylase [Chloroflexi bacterium]|nr:phosphonopyruvate decarboxylase [Chloroflexota bacterium]